MISGSNLDLFINFSSTIDRFKIYLGNIFIIIILH